MVLWCHRVKTIGGGLGAPPLWFSSKSKAVSFRVKGIGSYQKKFPHHILHNFFKMVYHKTIKSEALISNIGI